MKLWKVKEFKIICIYLKAVDNFYKDIFCLNRQTFTVKILQVTDFIVLIFFFFVLIREMNSDTLYVEGKSKITS